MSVDYIGGLAGATTIQTAEYNLVSILRPAITIDGNRWCVLYGENLQEGIAGFGDSPYLAVLDFNKAWETKLEQKPQ